MPSHVPSAASESAADALSRITDPDDLERALSNLNPADRDALLAAANLAKNQPRGKRGRAIRTGITRLSIKWGGNPTPERLDAIAWLTEDTRYFPCEALSRELLNALETHSNLDNFATHPNRNLQHRVARSPHTTETGLLTLIDTATAEGDTGVLQTIATNTGYGYTPTVAYALYAHSGHTVHTRMLVNAKTPAELASTIITALLTTNPSALQSTEVKALPNDDTGAQAKLTIITFLTTYSPDEHPNSAIPVLHVLRSLREHGMNVVNPQPYIDAFNLWLPVIARYPAQAAYINSLITWYDYLTNPTPTETRWARSPEKDPARHLAETIAQTWLDSPPSWRVPVALDTLVRNDLVTWDTALRATRTYPKSATLRRAMIANPNYPGHGLAEIAVTREEKNDLTHRVLARREDTPAAREDITALLPKITSATDNRDQVGEWLHAIASTEHEPTLLNYVTHHDDPKIRRLVATCITVTPRHAGRNISTSEPWHSRAGRRLTDALLGMRNDPDASVRARVAANTILTLPDLEPLRNDPRASVRSVIAKRFVEFLTR